MNLHFYGTNIPFFPEHYAQLIVAHAFFSGSISQVWSCQFYIYHEHELHASRIVNIEWRKKQQQKNNNWEMLPSTCYVSSSSLFLSLSLFCLSLFLHSFLICIAMKLLGMIVHFAPYVVICMCITWANSNKLENLKLRKKWKKGIKMGITALKIARSRKTQVPTLKTTIYLPKWQF